MNKDFEKPDSTAAWSRMSYEEKNKALFERQKKLLDLFLSKHAISREIYEEAVESLTAKFKE